MAKPTFFVLGSFVIACSAKLARFPAPGESLRAEAVVIEPGGKGFNLAAGLGRLGCAVDGLIAIGDDMRSAFAAPALVQAGLSTGMLVRVAGATGAGVGFTDAAGETCLAVDPAANARLDAGHVAAAAARIGAAKMVLAQFEIADPPIAAAFGIARRAGRTTLLNPSPFRPPPAALLADTGVLVVNESEAAALAAILDVPAEPGRLAASPAALARLAEAIHRCGPDLVVVTLGAAGVFASPRGERPLRQPAFAVTAVDTLGCGDAFAAGLAAALAEARPLPEALRRAAACGALMAQRLGVLAALPVASELEAFLASA